MLSLSRVVRTVVFQCGCQALDLLSFIEMDNLVSGFGWIWFFKGSDNVFLGLGIKDLDFLVALTSQISGNCGLVRYFLHFFSTIPG